MPGLLTLFGVGLLIAMAFGVWATARTLGRPPRRTYSWAVARARPGDPSELPAPRAFRAWDFPSRGVRLPAWDLAGDDPAGPVIIVTHGWGDSRVTMLARADFLATLASRVVLWDLPGHGEAPGRCGLGAEEAADLLALLAAVASDRRPVLYGFSMGAGVSLTAAAAGGAAAVIAEAPYRLAATPARNVLRAAGMPYRWNLAPALAVLGLPGLAPGVFDRARHAAALPCPLLVLHGELDGVCPPADGEAIAAAAPNGEFVRLPAADHLTVWSDPGSRTLALAAVRGFLERCGLRTGGGS